MRNATEKGAKKNRARGTTKENGNRKGIKRRGGKKRKV